MKDKNYGALFFLFLEAVGFSALLKIFYGIFWPILLDNYSFRNNMLYWFCYAVFIVLTAYLIRRWLGDWSLKDLGFTVHRSWALLKCVAERSDIEKIPPLIPPLVRGDVRKDKGDLLAPSTMPNW